MAQVVNEVQRDLVAVMCQRNFSIELSQLGDHEKDAILESFGVDIGAIRHQEYCKALVGSGISKLLEYYKNLTVDFKQMAEVCGWKEDAKDR